MQRPTIWEEMFHVWPFAFRKKVHCSWTCGPKTPIYWNSFFASRSRISYRSQSFTVLFLKKKKQGNEGARQKFRNNSPFLFFFPYTIPRYFPRRQRKNFHPQAQRKTFFGICSFSSLRGGECQSQQQNRPLKPQSPHPPFQAPFVRHETDRYVQPQKRSLIRNFCAEPRKRQPKSRSQYPNKTWNQRGSIKSFSCFSFSHSMFFLASSAPLPPSH